MASRSMTSKRESRKRAVLGTGMRGRWAMAWRYPSSSYTERATEPPASCASMFIAVCTASASSRSLRRSDQVVRLSAPITSPVTGSWIGAPAQVYPANLAL